MIVVIFSPLLHWLIRHLRFLPILFFGLCYVCRVFVPIHGFSATCFFFFSLGAFFSINGKNMVTSISRLRYPAYAIALVSMLILVWVNGRKGDGVTTQPQWVHLLYYAYVMSAVVAVVSIASWLLSAKKVRVIPWLARSSFFIFLSHIMVLGLVGRFTHHFIAPDSWALMTVEYLCRPLITTFLCLALYWFLERQAPRLLAVLTGGRMG